jgi:hypothetical protein
MSSPELVASTRLEALLGGAIPETQDEARLQGLARELRSASVVAPSSLRERVAGIGAAAQPRVRRPSRRLVAVLAVAIIVLAAGAFAALRFTTVSPTASENLGRPQAIEQELSRQIEPSAVPLSRPAILAPAPTGRAQDIDMWIDLRVSDADQVSSASQDAVRITRELGGVVTSSTVDTRGPQGRAQLMLRIPVGSLDDAVFRLTQLGTVTAQRTNTQDLQAPLDRVSQRIAEFHSKIRIELARLASGQLTPAEELEARVHLENVRRNLREAREQHKAILGQTTMADLTFRLATGAPGAVDENESGIAGAADKAADFLRGAGAVTVFLALVLSPLVLLAILGWLALRARNRRIEARLLDEPQPGAPTRSS